MLRFCLFLLVQLYSTVQAVEQITVHDYDAVTSSYSLTLSVDQLNFVIPTTGKLEYRFGLPVGGFVSLDTRCSVNGGTVLLGSDIPTYEETSTIAYIRLPLVQSSMTSTSALSITCTKLLINRFLLTNVNDLRVAAIYYMNENTNVYFLNLNYGGSSTFTVDAAIVPLPAGVIRSYQTSYLLDDTVDNGDAMQLTPGQIYFHMPALGHAMPLNSTFLVDISSAQVNNTFRTSEINAHVKCKYTFVVSGLKHTEYMTLVLYTTKHGAMHISEEIPVNTEVTISCMDFTREDTTLVITPEIKRKDIKFPRNGYKAFRNAYTTTVTSVLQSKFTGTLTAAPTVRGFNISAVVHPLLKITYNPTDIVVITVPLRYWIQQIQTTVCTLNFKEELGADRANPLVLSARNEVTLFNGVKVIEASFTFSNSITFTPLSMSIVCVETYISEVSQNIYDYRSTLPNFIITKADNTLLTGYSLLLGVPSSVGVVSTATNVFHTSQGANRLFYIDLSKFSVFGTSNTQYDASIIVAPGDHVLVNIPWFISFTHRSYCVLHFDVTVGTNTRPEMIGLDDFATDGGVLDLTIPKFIFNEYDIVDTYRVLGVQCSATYSSSVDDKFSQEIVNIYHTDGNYLLLERMSETLHVSSSTVTPSSPLSLEFQMAERRVREWGASSVTGTTAGSISQRLGGHPYNDGVLLSDRIEVSLRLTRSTTNIIADTDLITITVPESMLLYHSRDCRIESFKFTQDVPDGSLITHTSNPFSVVPQPRSLSGYGTIGTQNFSNMLSILYNSTAGGAGPNVNLGKDSFISFLCRMRPHTAVVADQFLIAVSSTVSTSVLEARSPGFFELYKHQMAGANVGYWPTTLDKPADADDSYLGEYKAGLVTEVNQDWNDYVRRGTFNTLTKLRNYYELASGSTVTEITLDNVGSTLERSYLGAIVIDFGYLNVHTDGSVSASVIVGNKVAKLRPLTNTEKAANDIVMFYNKSATAVTDGYLDNVVILSADLYQSDWVDMNAFLQTIVIRLENIVFGNINPAFVLPRIKILDPSGGVILNKILHFERITPTVMDPVNGNAINRVTTPGTGGGTQKGDFLLLQSAVEKTFTKLEYHVLNVPAQIGYLEKTNPNTYIDEITDAGMTDSQNRVWTGTHTARASNNQVDYTIVKLYKIGLNPLTNITNTTTGTIHTVYKLQCQYIVGTSWDSKAVYTINDSPVASVDVIPTTNTISLTLAATSRVAINDTLILRSSSLFIDTYTSHLVTCKMVKQDAETWKTVESTTTSREVIDPIDQTISLVYTTTVSTVTGVDNHNAVLMNSRIFVGNPQNTVTPAATYYPLNQTMSTTKRLVIRTLNFVMHYTGAVTMQPDDILMLRLPKAWTPSESTQCTIHPTATPTDTSGVILMPAFPLNYYNSSNVANSGPGATSAVAFYDIKYSVPSLITGSVFVIECDRVSVVEYEGTNTAQLFYIRGNQVLSFFSSVVIPSIFKPSGLTTRYISPDQLLVSQQHQYLYGVIVSTSSVINIGDYAVLTFPSTNSALSNENFHPNLNMVLSYGNGGVVSSNCIITTDIAYSNILSTRDATNPTFSQNPQKMKLDFVRTVPVNTTLYIRCERLSFAKVVIQDIVDTDVLSTISTKSIGVVLFDVHRTSLSPTLFLSTELSIPNFILDSGIERKGVNIASPAGNTITSIDVVVFSNVLPIVDDQLNIKIPTTWGVDRNSLVCGTSATSNDRLSNVRMIPLNDNSGTVIEQTITGTYVAASLKPTSALYMRCLGIKLPASDIVYTDLTVQLVRQNIVVMGVYDMETNTHITNVRDLIVVQIDMYRTTTLLSNEQGALLTAVSAAFSGSVIGGLPFIIDQSLANSKLVVSVAFRKTAVLSLAETQLTIETRRGAIQAQIASTFGSGVTGQVYPTQMVYYDGNCFEGTGYTVVCRKETSSLINDVFRSFEQDMCDDVLTTQRSEKLHVSNADRKRLIANNPRLQAWDGSLASCPLCSTGQGCNRNYQCLSGWCNPVKGFICVDSFNAAPTPHTMFIAVALTVFAIMTMYI